MNLRNRPGFTLLELLLAMAVFASIAAVVIPSAGSLLSDRRLVRGTDQLASEMTRLRIRAMRDGRIMVLRPGEPTAAGPDGLAQSSTWTVSPLYSAADSTESLDQTGSQSSLLTGASQTLDASAVAPVQADARVIEMPEGVLIQAIQASPVGGQNSVERATLMIGAAEVGSANMATATGSVSIASSGDFPPIYFYPTGQTSNARITLSHPEAGSAIVLLRGLTGDATVEATP